MNMPAKAGISFYYESPRSKFQRVSDWEAFGIQSCLVRAGKAEDALSIVV